MKLLHSPLATRHSPLFPLQPLLAWELARKDLRLFLADLRGAA